MLRAELAGNQKLPLKEELHPSLPFLLGYSQKSYTDMSNNPEVFSRDLELHWAHTPPHAAIFFSKDGCPWWHPCTAAHHQGKVARTLKRQAPQCVRVPSKSILVQWCHQNLQPFCCMRLLDGESNGWLGPRSAIVSQFSSGLPVL